MEYIDSAATVGVETSIILSAISARASRIVEDSTDAKNILMLDGRCCRKSSHMNELSVHVP